MTSRRALPTIADLEVPDLLGAIEGVNNSLGAVHHAIKSLNAVQQLGATPHRIRNSQSGLLSASAGRLAGYAFLCPPGGANGGATVRLRDGADLTDESNLLVPLMLLADQFGSAITWFLPCGISFSYGLFVEVVAGSDPVEGVVYTLPAGR